MDQSESIRRRPRLILSCLECRRKKLKCDRAQPCNQCQKAHQTNECSYRDISSIEQRPRSEQPQTPNVTPQRREAQQLYSTARHTEVEASNVAAPNERQFIAIEGPNKRQRTTIAFDTSSGFGVGVIEDLQVRVKKLENLLGQASSDKDHSTNGGPWDLYGHSAGSKVSSYGHNHRSTLLSPFEEAQKFLYGLPNDSVVKPYIQKILSFQRVLASQERESTATAVHRGDTLPSMFDAIPTKENCDQLVQAYSVNAEKAFRILHLPSFLSQYQRFWEGAPTDAPFAFIPQLLGVISAATSPSKPTPRPTVMFPVPRPVLIQIIDKWHEGLKRKERLTVAALQAKILSTLSAHNIFLPSDKTWNATGSLVRYAMCTGLHREHGHYKDVTIFEGEIRRRLWATIMEMDLQTSLVWGMPTAVRDGDWDTGPPSNVDDSDLAEDMRELPAPKPLETWTSALLQVVLSRSLPQRIRTAAFINILNTNASDEMRDMHGQAIEQLLGDVPAIAKADVFQHSGDEMRSASDMLGRVLLDIDIRRLLLYLYRPFAMKVSDAEIFFRSRRICRDSALVVLSHQDTFEPHSTELESADADEVWGLFETQCRHDVLLAALTICWEIRMMGSTRSVDARPSPRSSNGEGLSREPHDISAESANPTPWTKARLTRIVEDALSGLMQKLDKPGGFLKDVLGLAVVLQSVKSNASPERKEEMMRAGAINILETFLQRVMPDRSSSDQDTMHLRPAATDRPASFQGSTSDNDIFYQSGFPTGLEAYNFEMLPNGEFGMEGMDFNFSSDWNLF